MFSTFAYILLYIIFPVFVIIGIGALLQRKFQFDLNTLAKLNLYFFVPGIIFVKLYEAEFSMELLYWVTLFTVIFTALNLAVAWGAAFVMPLSRKARTVFSNSILFYNSGNYGIPVNGLAFQHNPYALSIQILTLLFQNLLTFTYGVFLMRSMQVSKLQAILGYFKMPIFYAIFTAIVLNGMNWEVPEFLMTPARFISDGLVSVALVTLGAQVAQLSFRLDDFRIWISMLLRLVAGPLIGLLVIWVLGLDGLLAQALLISTAFPTSVNSAIIAQEYDNEPELAARVVLVSTLVSSLTVSVVIYFAWALW